jgi:hypothetical protein
VAAFLWIIDGGALAALVLAADLRAAWPRIVAALSYRSR